MVPLIRFTVVESPKSKNQSSRPSPPRTQIKKIPPLMGTQVMTGKARGGTVGGAVAMGNTQQNTNASNAQGKAGRGRGLSQREGSGPAGKARGRGNTAMASTRPSVSYVVGTSEYRLLFCNNVHNNSYNNKKAHYYNDFGQSFSALDIQLCRGDSKNIK